MKFLDKVSPGLLCILFLLLGISLNGNAQNAKSATQNTLTVSTDYLAKARKFQAQSKTDSAVALYRKALPGLEKYQKWELLLGTLNELSYLCQQHFDRQQSAFFADSALSLLKKRNALFLGKNSGSAQRYLAAETYLLQAVVQAEKSNLEKALYCGNESLKILQKYSAWNTQPNRNIANRHARNYYELGRIYLLLGNYPQAAEKLAQAQKLAQNDALVAQAIGELSLKTGNYDKSYQYLQSSLKKQDKNNAYIKAATFLLLGQLHLEKGAFDSALFYNHKAGAIWAKITPEQHPLRARVLLYIGITYEKKGNYQLALEYEEKALNIILDPSNEEYRLERAEICDNIGVVYNLRGDVDQALQYHNNALNDYLSRLPEHHPATANCLYNIGNTHYSRREYRKAENHYERALTLAGKSLHENHPLLGALYNSFGMVYKAHDHHDKAQKHFKKALDIYSRVLHSKHHPYLAKIYENLGSLPDQQEPALTQNYSSHSLNMYAKTLGRKHPEVARSYYNLGVISHNAGNYEDALHKYQQAMISVVTSFEDTSIYAHAPLKEILSDNLMLQIMERKAGAFEKWYDLAQDEKKIQSAYTLYQLCTDLIDKMRSSYKAEGSKLFLAQHSLSIYERAIELSVRMFQITKDPYYSEKAFAFSEKSKAGVLRQAMAEAKARRISGVPDSLLEYENKLRSELLEYDKQLSQEQKNPQLANTAKVTALQTKILKVTHDYEQFTAFLEKSYSRYYEHKYHSQEIDVQHVMHNLLGKDSKHLSLKNSTLVEYFVGEQTIYIFTVSPGQYHVTAVAKDSLFEKQLAGFRTSILYQVPNVTYEYGTALYNKLIAPVEKYIHGKHVLVVPDAVLSTLPFDALIIDDRKKLSDRSYHQMEFIVGKYDFSYAYSATLLLEKETESSTAPNDFLAFAPVFDDQLQGEKVFSRSKRFAQVDLPRDVVMDSKFFSAIPGTETEIRQIEQLFLSKKLTTRIFTHEQATEEVIKSEVASGYKYIHFATHGFVSTDRPAFSGIIFSHHQQNSNQHEDGILYASEIYSLKLNADLVVLSACETGLGKIIKGEGIIGLTRSFLYAGAKNIVVSMWKVSDVSTAEMMTDFYKNILGRQNYSAALRKAKCRLLKNKKYASPYYWAPFVVVI